MTNPTDEEVEAAMRASFACWAEASMAEVSGFNERMTKREKHVRRLRAAVRAHTAAELLKAERKHR